MKRQQSHTMFDVRLTLLLLLDHVHLQQGLEVVGLSHGVYPAHTLASFRQLLTSSTLNWVDILLVQSGKIPPARVVVRDDSAVCRCKFGHRYEPGYTDLSGNCVVQGVKESEYQVLVDMFAMARLDWRLWDMFMVPSLGSVAFNERTFVGQMRISTTTGEDTKRIAELDYQQGLNGEFVVEVSPERRDSKTEGWVLLETEPIKYSMENVTFLSEKVVSTEPVHLGEVNLRLEGGEGEYWSEVGKRLEYSWSGQESWGNIGGTVRGLPCTVARGEEEVSHTKMGLTTNSHYTKDLQVTFMLLPETEVNITVSGEMVSLDQVYSATLLSVHKDGSLAVSNITGVRTSRQVTNIKIKHSGPVWLQSGLPAPTTVSPSTTRSTVSTSSPPATTASSEKTVAGMFLAASPTPTLFPPPPPPVTRPNPLKQFYPDQGDSELEVESFGDTVRVDILPLSAAVSPQDHLSSLALLILTLTWNLIL